MKQALNSFIIVAVAGFAATPALAGSLGTPAPVAGVGIGAAIVLGIGYRALRKRIDR